MSKIYSTILFDFDGTLTSSLELWLQAFHYAFSKYGKELPDEVIVERCFYRPFDDVVSEFELANPVEFGQLIKEGLVNCFDQAQLFLGVKEILSKCVSHDIKLAVVTSSPRLVVDRVLASLRIDSFFQTVVTADDIENFKPHPEPMLLALQRLSSNADKSLVIGDSSADMLAGQAAGIKTGLFFPEEHHRFYDLDKLKETEPHFVFHNYDELHGHLFT